MYKCQRCDKPLYGVERGNIRPSIPAGYEHRDCSVAHHNTVIINEVVVKKEEKPEVKEESVNNKIRYRPWKKQEDKIDQEGETEEL